MLPSNLIQRILELNWNENETVGMKPWRGRGLEDFCLLTPVKVVQS